MALIRQIAILVKLRALGWTSLRLPKLDIQQVVGYQLKKLKDQSIKKGTDEVFNAALVGGLARAATGISLVTLLGKKIQVEENEMLSDIKERYSSSIEKQISSFKANRSL